MMVNSALKSSKFCLTMPRSGENFHHQIQVIVCKLLTILYKEYLKDHDTAACSIKLEAQGVLVQAAVVVTLLEGQARTSGLTLLQQRAFRSLSRG